MSENTRKFYIEQGNEFEQASNYKGALASYLEAFSIKECSAEDDKEFFAPAFIEDKIAFLAYRLGDYRTALSYGAMAYRLNPSDNRLRNNLPFYTDGILFTNPKEHLDKFITDYIKGNFESGAKILDVGPYDGRWSYALRSTFPNMDAVEAFEPYLEKYNLRSLYNQVFLSDIMEFEFDYYDLIIIGDVLEHLTIEEAQKLVDRLYNKCGELLIIIPYEYPQDEYDDNKYQIHKQEDLTDEIMHERYPQLNRLAFDEVRGAYIKKSTKEVNINEKFKGTDPFYNHPKTTIAAMQYYVNGSYSIAAGVFEDSLEEMSADEMAYARYYLGICHQKLEHNYEALKYFLEAVNYAPNYRSAYYEAFKILEKSGLWKDFEFYLRKALDHKNETFVFDDNAPSYWENLLLIQMTFVLSNLGKKFEAYGYAYLALETEMDEGRKKTAEHNYAEMKRELLSTLQVEVK